MKDLVNVEFLKSGAILTTWTYKQTWGYRLVCGCSEPIQIDIEDEFSDSAVRSFRGLHCVFSHRGRWWKSVYGADLNPGNILNGCTQVMRGSEYGCRFTWSQEVHQWLRNVELRYEG